MRQEMNAQITAILQPEMDRIMEFMRFGTEAVATISRVVRSMVQQRREDDATVFTSRTLGLSLLRALGVIVQMDAVKDVKSSLNNDLSIFKR